MRINPANITAQGNQPLSSNTSPAADKTATRGQGIEARDSYNKKSAASTPHIIDAEYVEFYNSETKTFEKERHTLDNTIAADNKGFNLDEQTGSKVLAQNRYPIMAHNAPPPGSIIDTFA